MLNKNRDKSEGGEPVESLDSIHLEESDRVIKSLLVAITNPLLGNLPLRMIQKGQTPPWTWWELIRECLEALDKYEIHPAARTTIVLPIREMLSSETCQKEDIEKTFASNALVWAGQTKNREVFEAALEFFRDTRMTEKDGQAHARHWIYKPLYEWPVTASRELGIEAYFKLVRGVSQPSQGTRSPNESEKFWNVLIQSIGDFPK